MDLRLVTVAWLLTLPYVFFLGKRVKQAGAELEASRAHLTQAAEDLFQGRDILTQTNAIAYAQARLEQAAIDLKRKTVRSRLLTRLSGYFGYIYYWLKIGLFAAVSALFYFKGYLTPGEAVAAPSLITMLSAPMRALVRVVASKHAVDGITARIAPVLEPQQSDLLPSHAAFTQHDALCPVRLTNVSVNYDEVTLFEQLSIDIDTGQLVALVGPSGSGKTTILRLLCGFTVPTTGKVLVWGQDPYSSRIPSQLLGYMPQQPAFFSGAILENIALGRAISVEAINELCHQTGLSSFAASFPQGLNTVIDATDLGLSGGEQRLIAFLRCLAGKPQLIILDEPTASLSEHHRTLLVDAIRKYANDNPAVTWVISTHDEVLMDLASKIVRLG
ncbi:MAG: ABC transporter ATP-binding protein [Firmicutes bacterium]|nr:ABC transporter ATP-binding protein [Bacillota bacterium]